MYILLGLVAIGMIIMSVKEIIDIFKGDKKFDDFII